MANILDYIDWRGDLPMEVSPVNEVDVLILSELAYLDFSNIISSDMEAEPVTICDAVTRYFEEHEDQDLSLGLILPSAIFDMAKRMANSPRFKDLPMWGYVNDIDMSTEIQFSAVCIDINRKTTFVSYRGTDDTLIGWKEDFNMALSPEIPAQYTAVDYVNRVARHTRNKLILGGHSKGGNLAVYAAAKCSARTRKRLINAYSYDGPGFTKGFLSTTDYRTIQNRVVSIVPQDSIVGMLLEHLEDHIIVASSSRGLLQHDGYTWQVIGSQFVRSQGLSEESILINRTVNAWLASMDDDQKRQFTDAFFDILFSSDATTLDEINRDKRKFLRAMANVDSSKRKFVNDKLAALFREGKQTIASMIESTLKEIKENLFSKAKK